MFKRAKDRVKEAKSRFRLGAVAEHTPTVSGAAQSSPSPAGSGVATPLSNAPTPHTSAPTGHLPPATAVPPPPDASASNSPPTGKRGKTDWSGLRTLLKVLETSTSVFAPLKSAFGELNQCVDLFEGAAKGRKEFDELRTVLNSLMDLLIELFGSPMAPTMTASIKSLCSGIEKELNLVKERQGRGLVQRYAEVSEDMDEVLGCYRRIQGHIERLTLNANMNIWKIADEQATESRLRKLSPSLSAVYNSAESEDLKRGPCTPGTREQELTKLRGWARDMAAADVCWMNGMAGTGKTTIAYSLCNDLSESAELGASFFCSRLIPECRNVKLILPSIAYQLARFSHPFRFALSRVLEVDPDVHTRMLKTQFEGLLVKPLQDVQRALPLDFVIVIDALDECENENGPGLILDVLLSHSAAGLPIRFLLSSRPEPEIYSRMMNRVGDSLTARLVLHDLDTETVKRDIRTYLYAELSSVPLTDAQFAALVDQSGALFIYAATAARYIKDGLELMDHEERLDTVLGLSQLDDNEHLVDVLYTAILDAAFKNRKLNSSNRRLMQMVLNTVICAQEPMNLSALAEMLQLKSSKQVDALLRPLLSVVNVTETTGLVTTLHASFPDFMLDHRRSSAFHCDPVTNHGRLAQACFELIKSNVPQFNLCGLESSYIHDDEVSDLDEKASQSVSTALLYASKYCSSHLKHHGGDKYRDLVELLHDFLSVRLLLWMEVLNVKKCMSLGAKIIQQAESWSRTYNCPDETLELAHDAWRFVTMFTSHAVSRSTPHIYVSMLPLWPKSGPISEHYMKRIQGPIRAKGTAMERRQLALLATWPVQDTVQSVCASPEGSLIALGISSSVHVIDGNTGRNVLGPLEHKEYVASVCFSPDGALIASCSWDETIRVWNAQNGQAPVDPFTGHTGEVNSICFSPDSTLIVSGSDDKTLRVWNIWSGQTVVGPLKGHTGWVNSVCFSPDGTRIASGSGDKTVRVWDARNGLMVASPLEGHTDHVRSVCFSPDGTRIVSGSHDKTIRVWAVQSGQLIAGPFEGHTGLVLSVKFSPNDRYIISGSADNTIRLWDLLGSDLISVKVLEGHTSSVISVTFSPDGSRIISCSLDMTVRVWDTQSPATTTHSRDGHTETVTSVRFSPDGKHIASGSTDRTIRMWDARSGQTVGSPFHEHNHGLWSVSFSPDGKHIASGSDDKNVRVWDIQSGDTVIGPLQGHTDMVRSVCYSPVGSLIASASSDGTIRMWDAKNGNLVGTPLKEHTRGIGSICFSPDGMRIVSGVNSSIRVWDIQSGKTVVGPLEGHHSRVSSVCFSPDGIRIASGSEDQAVRVWDAESGQVVFGSLNGHTGSVTSVCFSPDSKLLVSSSSDKTIRLWDAKSGEAIGCPLRGHTSLVKSVDFSPDGMYIVSGSFDMTIRVWEVRCLLRTRGSEASQWTHSPESTLGSSSQPSWVLQEDGWMVDSQSRLLAWVPPDLHVSLLWPCNTLLISPAGLWVK